MTRQWRFLSAAVLLVLLVGSGSAVPAAPDSIAEAVQRSLAERGFDPGEIDGAMGARTRQAIRAFQRSVGLPDTGQVDLATQEALGLEPAGGAQAAADTAALQFETPAMEPEPGPEPKPGPEPEPNADAPQSEPSTAGSDTATSADASDSNPPPTDAAPERAAGPRMSFTFLNWHPPQSAVKALERFDAIGAPRVFRRGTGALFVPKPELVFVLKAGEEVPGLDCDPGAGRMSIEFVFGPDGPVIFTPISGVEYCQVGIGIALVVGRTLEMRRVDWGDVQYPRGTVRVTNQGLEYVR